MSHLQPHLGGCRAIGSGWTLLLWAAVTAGGVARAGSATPHGPSHFEDPALPLAPVVARSETDVDRIEAQALVATARLFEDRSRPDQGRRQPAVSAWYELAALRKYERAFRRDPRATRLLRSIIALAQASGRVDEAAHYAAIATERDPSDTGHARWLALYYADQGRFREARRLYETIVATRAGQANTNAPPKASLSLWLELGRLAYLTEHHPQASAAFTAVETALRSPLSGASDRRVRTVLLENTPLAFKLFGEAHLAAGNLDAAEASFRSACQTAASRGTLAFHLARIAQRRHEPERAQQKLQEYFDSDADQGIAPYQLLADLHTDQGQQNHLIEHLERLHKNEPDNIPLATFLARHYLIRGQLEPAEATFRQVLGKLRPKGRPPHPGEDSTAIGWPPASDVDRDNEEYLAEALEGLTEIYRRRGNAAALLQILAKTAEQTDSLECIGQPLAKIVRDDRLLDAIFGAAETAQANKKRRPDTTEQDAAGVDLALAELAVATQRFDSVGLFLHRAIERRPDRAASVLYEWGIALLDRQQYAAAADVFRQGLARQLGPKDPAYHRVYRANLYFFLAGALEMTGATDRALSAAQQAVQLQSDSALIASRQPWIYRHAKQPTAARRDYRQLLDSFDLNSTDRPTRTVLQAARFELAQLAIDRHDLPAAEQWLEQVLDEDPRNVGALNDLGYLWADQDKHLQRALAMVRQAVDAEPENRAYRDSLGWAYFRLGSYHEAITHLEEAANGIPPDGVVLDHLGDCYEQLGRHADAVAHWRRSATWHNAQGHRLQAARLQKKLGREPPSQPLSQEATNAPHDLD